MITTAVILAAGRGTKMWPYGDTWPKTLLPLANRPLLLWQIQILQAFGIQKIVVVIGHRSAQVRDVVGDLQGVELLEQKQPHGSADSLLCGLACVKEERFLVCHGDGLFAGEDLRRVLDAAEKNPQVAMVQRLENRSPQEWLCANTADGHIVEILGHPREASFRLCGVYVLTREMLSHLANNPGIMCSVEVGVMPPEETELAESVSRFIQRGGQVEAVECKELFYDLDKPWHLLDANKHWLEYQGSKLKENRIHPTAHVDSGAQIGGFLCIGENSVIGKGVIIKGNLWVGDHTQIIDGAIVGENTAIGSHSLVREYCRIDAGSSIGSHCVVGHCAELGGILMDGAYAYHYGEYWGILGRSSDLGAATVCGNLRFDDQRTAHRIRGRREVPQTNSANAAYLGDYTRTGVNAILMPGVKVGSYSVIGAGVILHEDVPNNSLVYVKQEQIHSTWGPEKYGW